ncbi:MAG: phage tail protein [Roseiarcus sp.]|jgi:hypothetical protein
MTQTYANTTTQYFNDLIAAAQAGGAAVNLAGGTLVVGDGNGAVPALSALVAANGVTHEVWRGAVIQGVSIDPDAANQIDVAVDIPASSGGAEIGPFTVREFAILDALGNCCVVGTTNLEKTISSQGQTSDLAWTVAVVVASTNAVVITPPTAGYATMAQVIAGYDANLPDCVAPITKTDTPLANGWLRRVFGISPASQPADVVTPTTSAAAMGSGRPASAAEYAAGAGTAGGFAWPWPTLQQVAAEFASVMNSIAAVGASLAGYLLKSGGTMSGSLILAHDPAVAAEAATKHYVDAAVGGVAGFLPLAGGTMTGPLITERDPQEAMEVANKEYVDAAAANPWTASGVGALMMGGYSWSDGGLNPPSGLAQMIVGSTVSFTAASTVGWVGNLTTNSHVMISIVDVRFPTTYGNSSGVAPPGVWEVLNVATDVTLRRVS